MQKRAAFLLSLFLMVTILACGLTAGGTPTEDPKASQIIRVAVLRNDQNSDSYQVVVDYRTNPEDANFKITCRVPDENGKMVDYGAILFSPSDTYTDFYITVKQPGNYTVECSDGKHSEEGPFTAEQGVTISDVGTEPEKPPVGSFKIPKPGDFASAGLWMYFDQGSSDLAGYPVPQQCLPGVNYTHVGGKSNFDIDPAGDITGFCSLSYYDGAQRLTGSITGTWDGQSDQITFRLETKTEYDAVVNGKPGSSVNKTTYDGVASFNSEIQASGTATWHTECTSTDPDVVMCFTAPYAGALTANGTIPFVINFNP